MTRSLRFVHAADLHLDSPFKGLQPMPDALREQVIQSGLEAWDALVDLTLEQEADALLLCGDLHDSNARSLRSQWRLTRGMERLVQAGVQVFIIHGNHDPMNVHHNWEWPSGVVVMSAEQPESYWITNQAGEIAAVVTGMSYGTQAVYDNLAARYPNNPEVELSDTGKEKGFVQRPYRIGMLHGTVDGRQDHDPYAPCSKQQLIEKGYDYWALGHIHKREILHEAPWIIYPGNLQGRHVKETGAKGAYVVDVNADGSSAVRFHALDRIRWVDAVLSLDEVHSKQELVDLLLDRLEQWRDEDVALQLVRITLAGRSVLHRELMSGTLLAELEAMWKDAEQQHLERGEAIVWPVAVRVDSRSLTNVAEWRESDHFIGEAVRITEQIIEENEALQQWMNEALQPLLQQRRLLRWSEELSDERRKELLDEALHLVVDMLEGDVAT